MQLNKHLKSTYLNLAHHLLPATKALALYGVDINLKCAALQAQFGKGSCVATDTHLKNLTAILLCSISVTHLNLLLIQRNRLFYLGQIPYN